ncbi:MAG: hypothetical protein FJW39_15350 [Acidobacteria bacterium]|nr:hypothetical protein [Acidobacteriota bacterium]
MKSFLIVAAAANAAWSVPAVERVPPGQLVTSYLGRFNLDINRNGTVVAYLTQLAGVPGPLLFNGEAGENTARFTVVSTPIRLELLRMDALIHARPVPVSGDAVRFRLYYDEFPAVRDSKLPETYQTGRLVAVLRGRPWSFTAVPLLMAHAEGVQELESSEDFFIQGQRVNFRQVTEAIRTNILGGPTPAVRSDAETLSFPIGGTAVAVEAFPPRTQ